MEAKIFFGSYKPVVLKRALTHAGQDGFVASMPQLIHARTNAPYDNVLWNTWFIPTRKKTWSRRLRAIVSSS